MLILSDFKKFEEYIACQEEDINFKYLSEDGSWVDLFKVLFVSDTPKIFIINGNLRWIFKLALLKIIFGKRFFKLIAVDLVLRAPETFKDRVLAHLKRFLFKQVDHFIHYFKDLKAFEHYFGISASRSSYVSFKANFFDKAIKLDTGEEYLYMAGISQRDYQCFVNAAKLTGLPAAVLDPRELRDASVCWPEAKFPSNVDIIENDGSQRRWYEAMAKAKLVVLAIKAKSICSSGISTYLDAMALGKAVILSKGPGGDDVLTEDLALFVKPGDINELAEAINTLWHDDVKRQRLSKSGEKYALSLGDEAALIDRIFKACQKSGMLSSRTHK